LILFRQQRPGINRGRARAEWLSGGSDLFRVIVLHGVFVPAPGTAARRMCTVRLRIRNDGNALGPHRAYATLPRDRLSRAPFSNANPRTYRVSGCYEFRTNNR